MVNNTISKSEDRTVTIAPEEDSIKRNALKYEKSAWESVELARHPGRPSSKKLILMMSDGFFEIKGDRAGSDDCSIICGIANISGRSIAVAAHEKGSSPTEREKCRFGMSLPSGFRKSKRLFGIAEKLGIPILCLIDTPGAYPCLEAENGGQAWAISENIKCLLSVKTPVINVFIGEGGSGGALALGVGDAALILQHANFSVISPEGCSTILWKSKNNAERAATLLKLGADEIKDLGLVNHVLAEPNGGAHKDPEALANSLKYTVCRYLDGLCCIPIEKLLEERIARFGKMDFYCKR